MYPDVSPTNTLVASYLLLLIYYDIGKGATFWSMFLTAKRTKVPRYLYTRSMHACIDTFLEPRARVLATSARYLHADSMPFDPL